MALTDDAIDEAQSHCPALGAAPPHKRQYRKTACMTYAEIGRALGISRQYVQQIERRALEKLARLWQYEKLHQ